MSRKSEAAQSEEDVRHAFNSKVDAFIADAGLEVVGRHEYFIAGGRIDSVYSRVILEFKFPNGPKRLGDSLDTAGSREVCQQITDRFTAFIADDGVPPEKLFGVGTDGRAVIFARMRGGQVVLRGPFALDPHTIATVLRAIVSVGARGKSYVPNQLVHDFGSANPEARANVRSLVAALEATTNTKALTLFRQWRLLFAEMCGFDVDTSTRTAELAKHYELPAKTPPAQLLFAIHTYYALIMKLIATEIVAPLSGLPASTVASLASAPSTDALRDEARALEDGGIWRMVGISNFLEGDLFSWYSVAWDDGVASAVRSLAQHLDDYDPATLSVDPGESKDLLKDIYQQLFPDKVRHDLGEYYTPDWLAQHLLNRLEYDGNPDTRVLDPACGSGTFLVEEINRARTWYQEHRFDCGFDQRGLLSRIVSNIVGFDLNPLAVMAARTNYLLAIRDLLRGAGAIDIPVHLCDSILPPMNLSTPVAPLPYRRLETAVGHLNIPEEIMHDGQLMAAYTRTLEDCISLHVDGVTFLARLQALGLPTSEVAQHQALYRKITDLEAADQDGIWARIIKNQSAPVFSGRFDYIAGNPPWIQWESLPRNYRDQMKPVWESYGLFSLSGLAARLGGGKKDLSMLFLYACIDNYLQPKGLLGFLITQSVFKSKNAGDGFRRFEFTKDHTTTRIQPLIVDDLSGLQPFSSATTMTTAVICRTQSTPTKYPIDYVVWRRRPARVGTHSQLEEVMATTTQTAVSAVPLFTDFPTSPWLTVPDACLAPIRKAIGASAYRARAGMTTWLNGVFLIDVVGDVEPGVALVKNRGDCGKTKVRTITAPIESDLIYTSFLGNEIRRWNGTPTATVVLTQDPVAGRGIAPEIMQRDYWNAFRYLSQFEKQLRARSGYKQYFDKTDPFWSVYNVHPDLLSEWKVVWNSIDTHLRAVVVGPDLQGRPVLCRNIHTYIACANANEAHYLCALINSSISNLIVRGYSVSKGFAAPHIAEAIGLPKFDVENKLHAQLAKLSKTLHSAAQHVSNSDKVATMEGLVDALAADLHGLTPDDLRTVQAGLAQL